MNLMSTGIFTLALFVVGFGMSLLIPLGICNKLDSDSTISALKHAGIWMVAPVGVFIILELSPWTLSIFSGGVQSIFGWFKAESDQHSYDTLGMAWALILAGLIMTTYIVHSLDVEVCKPDAGQMQAFEEHLLKRQKDKDAAKAHDEAVIKPNS